MAQRIKGQEVTVAFTTPEGDFTDFTDVLSATITLENEILEESYLGEVSNRYDDIYNGVSGSVEMHLENNQFVTFMNLVQDRSERRAPAAGQFNVSMTFALPNGERARVTCEDVFWGPIPVEVGGRADYVKLSLEFKCSRMRRVI